jgi:hypothetical protein
MMRVPTVATFSSDLVAVLAQQVQSVQSVQSTTTVQAARIAVVFSVLKILVVYKEVTEILGLELPLRNEVASLLHEFVPIFLIK